MIRKSDGHVLAPPAPLERHPGYELMRDFGFAAEEDEFISFVGLCKSKLVA